MHISWRAQNSLDVVMCDLLLFNVRRPRRPSEHGFKRSQSVGVWDGDTSSFKSRVVLRVKLQATTNASPANKTTSSPQMLDADLNMPNVAICGFIFFYGTH